MITSWKESGSRIGSTSNYLPTKSQTNYVGHYTTEDAGFAGQICQVRVPSYSDMDTFGQTKFGPLQQANVMFFALSVWYLNLVKV